MVMTPERRIEKYYLDRLYKYESEIGKAIETILGPEFRKLYDVKKDGFRIVFTASREGIEYHLGNTPTKAEKEVMEYLFEKMDEERKDIIVLGGEFLGEKNNRRFVDFLQGNDIFYGYFMSDNNAQYGYVKIDIFRDSRNGLDLDLEYFWRLLYFHLLRYYDNNKKSWYYPTKSYSIDCDIHINNIEQEMFLRIVDTIAMQIVALLRNKEIFLIDNPDEFDLDYAIGRYKMVNPKFIATFQELLPIFLLEPGKFIEIVGKDNFRDFTIATLDSESSLDIDEIINKMQMEREKKVTYEITAINLPLIAKAKSVVEGKKSLSNPNNSGEGKQTQSVSRKGYTEFGSSSFGVDSLEARGLINNNLPIIDKFGKDAFLKKKDDSWKYFDKNDFIDDDWKYRGRGR